MAVTVRHALGGAVRLVRCDLWHRVLRLRPLHPRERTQAVCVRHLLTLPPIDFRHIATLGHYAIKGAALVFIEASGVQANGRISPNCPGIWSDDQIPGVKAVADFVHSQGALCGMQLAHAGRKASTCPPFVNARHGKASMRATVDVGGWPEDVVGPSGGEELTWDGPQGEGYWPPREMTVEDIREQVEAWKEAARRSVQAGCDVIEIHGAVSPGPNRIRWT